MAIPLTGDDIKAARKQLGLNQEQFAQVIGYNSKNRVSEVENGKNEIGRAREILIELYLDGARPKCWPKDSAP